MTMTRTIGGNRLGSGKKMTVDMKTYERSTHNLSYIWRSTMAAGTLTPFLKELALPGDTFDINLDCDVLTHPTVGPLFGSYKVQLDVFMTPIRLYQAQLHNNKLGIGLDMASIKLPQVQILGINPTGDRPDNQQINPSCIFSYLDIRGLGHNDGSAPVGRNFNAIPFLAYWDIYKNYYANKQEEIGAVIHNPVEATEQTVDTITLLPFNDELPEAPLENPMTVDVSTLQAIVAYTGTAPLLNQIIINTSLGEFSIRDLFTTINAGTGSYTLSGATQGGTWYSWRYAQPNDVEVVEPQVTTFPLSNIDLMRENILADIADPNAYVINMDTNLSPYTLPLLRTGTFGTETYRFSVLSTMEGLALKTYQSDLLNNWIQTDWLDGTNGINEITAIDTSGGSFTLDTLLLSKKVYDMLNRIAISGGTYDDWLDTVYTHDRFRSPETPMYMGGLIKELTFQEVISNSESTNQDGIQPLGTLAGRGKLTNKHKGGHIIIKVDEPSYIQGIISLTPRLDYSQGNKWDVNLKTMDDLHKPALDEIGFQDLVTDQMFWADTECINTATQVFKSAGKQPAWINYMTNVNQTRGNFAVKDNEMFMTLNRGYLYDEANETIADLTTYIDPIKFNNIFAQTSRDAQNFWTQIAVDITARRKMSARIIPNL